MAQVSINNPSQYIPDYSFIGQAGNIVSGLVKDFPELQAMDRSIRDNDNHNNDVYDSVALMYKTALNDDSTRLALAERLGLDPTTEAVDDYVNGLLKRPSERQDKNEYMSKTLTPAIELFKNIPGAGDPDSGVFSALGQASVMGGGTEAGNNARKHMDDVNSRVSREEFFKGADKYTSRKDAYANIERLGGNPASFKDDPRFDNTLKGIDKRELDNAMDKGIEDYFTNGLQHSWGVALNNLSDPQNEEQRTVLKERWAMLQAGEKARALSDDAIAKKSADEKKELVGSIENYNRDLNSRINSLRNAIATASENKDKELVQQLKAEVTPLEKMYNDGVKRISSIRGYNLTGENEWDPDKEVVPYGTDGSAGDLTSNTSEIAKKKWITNIASELSNVTKGKNVKDGIKKRKEYLDSLAEAENRDIKSRYDNVLGGYVYFVPNSLTGVDEVLFSVSEDYNILSEADIKNRKFGNQPPAPATQDSSGPMNMSTTGSGLDAGWE